MQSGRRAGKAGRLPRGAAAGGEGPAKLLRLVALYVAPVATVSCTIQRHVSHVQFADDTQLYIAFDGANSSSIVDDNVCTVAVSHWFALSGLSLNPNKSEVIVIGTSARQRVEGAESIL